MSVERGAASSRRSLIVTSDPPDERDVAPPATSPHIGLDEREDEQIQHNMLEVILFRALSTPLAFLLVIIQSRFLHPDGRGAFVVTVLTVTVFSRLLGDLGNAATNQAHGRHDALGAWMVTALWLSVILGFVGSVLVVALGRVISDAGFALAVLGAAALIPNLLSRTISGILVGLARVRVWNYVQLASPVVAFAGLIVLVVGFGAGTRGAVVAWGLGHVMAAAIGLALTRDIWWPPLRRRLPRRSMWTLLQLALLMGLVNVATLINYRVELFILRQYHDLTEVGFYSVSVQVAESLWLITTAIATAIVAPCVQESEEDARQLVTRSTIKGILLTGAAAGVVLVLAPFTIPLIFGETYDESVQPLVLLLPGVVTYGPVAILTVYLSVRRGRAQYVLGGALLSILVTTALSLSLIPEYGAEGAAVASSCGYVVSGLAAWVVFVRLAGIRWYGRPKAASGAAF